jgi:hypothetical protein
MKCSKRSFAVISPLFAVLLSLGIGTLSARDADLASRTLAAAQTAKQKCTRMFSGPNAALSFICRWVRCSG